MGDLIQLPNAKKRKRKKLEDILVEKLSDHEHHCSIGNVNVTCATCGSTSNINFTKMVFKICEFYCSVCGTGYKISNPIFTKRSKSNIK